MIFLVDFATIVLSGQKKCKMTPVKQISYCPVGHRQPAK